MPQVFSIASGTPVTTAASSSREDATGLGRESSGSVNPSVSSAPGEAPAAEGAHSPTMFASRLQSNLKRAVCSSDIYALLAPQADAEFKTLFRGLLSADLDCAIANHEVFAEFLARSGLTEKQVRRLNQLNDKVLRDMACLRDGEPLKLRAFRTAGLLAPLPLPLAITLLTHQKKTTSFVVARITRNLAALAALVSRDSSNSQAFRQFFDNRILPSLLVWAPFAIPAFIPGARPLMKNPAFTFPMAGLGALALFAHFNKDNLVKGAEKFSGCGAAANEDGRLTSEQRDHLDAWRDALAHQRDNLHRISEAFKTDQNEQISDNLNYLFSSLLRGVDDIVADLGRLTAGAAPIASAETTHPSPSNPDFYSKLVVLALVAGISVAQIALIYPEVSGLVSLAIDGAFTVSEIAKSLYRPSDNLQATLQTFKDLQGLSLLLVGYLGLDKALGFTGGSALALWGSTALLSLANLTLPGPVAGMTAAGLGTVLERIHASLSPPPRDSAGRQGDIEAGPNGSDSASVA